MEASACAVSPLVVLDRRGNPTSDDLATGELAALASATRTPFFSIPHFARRGQQRRVWPLARVHNWQGLILADRRVNADFPVPFREPFEPIELNVGDTATKAVIGDTAIVQTWRNQLRITMIVILLLLFAAGIGLQLWFSPSRVRTLSQLALLIVPVPLFVFALRTYRRHATRWFLVPAGVFVAECLRSSDSQTRLITRNEAIAYVGFGRRRHRRWIFIELWLPDERIYKVVSRSDALAFIAAWRSPVSTPPVELLQELAT